MKIQFSRLAWKEGCGMENACLLPFLRKFPTVQLFQNNYIFLTICPFYSALDFTLVCVTLPPGLFLHLLLSNVFWTFSNKLRRCLPLEAFPSFPSLDLGLPIRRRLNLRDNPAWCCAVDTDGNYFPFCLQPLPIKCEALWGESLCFHLNFFFC